MTLGVTHKHVVATICVGMCVGDICIVVETTWSHTVSLVYVNQRMFIVQTPAVIFYTNHHGACTVSIRIFQSCGSPVPELGNARGFARLHI